MGCKVIPTATFAREYSDIVRYLVEHLDAPHSAQLLMNAMDKARRNLADNPKAYPVSRKPMLEMLELRECIVRSYVVVYRVEGECVFLEHIFHQKQDFERGVSNSR